MKKIVLIMLLCLTTYPCFGAELIVKIGNSSDPLGFKDGDIIHAFNDKRILNVHAQHICHPKNFSKNSDGLREPDTLLQTYLENTKEFKFERVNEKTIKRITIATSDFELLSDIPNVKGQYIDVPLYIERRLRHERHQIFGTKGHEYWYGGKTLTTLSDMNKVWVEIEKKTAYKKADHRQFPFTDKELSKYYAITIDDLTDLERSELESSIKDVDDNVVEKRKHKVNYLNLLGVSLNDKSDIQNKKKKVDHRKIKSFLRSNIVVEK